MRLVSYEAAGTDGNTSVWRAGVLLGDRIVDAAVAGAGLAPPESLSRVRGILSLDAAIVADLGRAAASAEPVGTLEDAAGPARARSRQALASGSTTSPTRRRRTCRRATRPRSS